MRLEVIGLILFAFLLSSCIEQRIVPSDDRPSEQALGFQREPRGPGSQEITEMQSDDEVQEHVRKLKRWGL